MKHVLLKFVITLFFLSIALMFVPDFALKQAWIESVPSFPLEIITTLVLLTLVLFYYLQKTQVTNPQKFIQRYMLSITVKMLVGCGLILVIIFMDRESAMANALLFIISYFSLTGVEIFFLWKGRTAS